jgi:hypothetical protein
MYMYKASGKTIAVAVFILCLFMLLFKINISWAQVSSNSTTHAKTDERQLFKIMGNPFQTHYFAVGTRGSSCKNMKKHFDKIVRAKWKKMKAVEIDKLDLEWISCKEVKNTLSPGSPLETQLEVQVALNGLCPRQPQKFKSIKFIDAATVDTSGVTSPFIKHLGIKIGYSPNLHLGNTVFTNGMEFTVSGCDASGNYIPAK